MENGIREFRRQKGFTMKQLGEMVGVAESTISQYETGKREPDNETLLRIGEALDTTVDSLLRPNFSKTKNPSALTEKDKRDISKQIEEMLGDLESEQSGLMFDGEPMDDETRELLAASLRNSMEISKLWAKKKFTPKKYKKDE